MLAGTAKAPAAATLLWTCVLACGGGSQETPQPAPAPDPTVEARSEPAPACPSPQPAPALLPGTSAEHLTLDYWLEQVGARHDLDQVLLSPDDIRTLDAAMKVPRERFFPQVDLSAPFDEAEMRTKLDERVAWLRDKLASGEYVDAQGRSIPPAVLSNPPTPAFAPALHVALDLVPMYCAPTTTGLFSPKPDRSIDHRIDRNRCSTAHPQEVVQVLAPWPGNMLLARTRYSWGFIEADVALSPALDRRHGERFVHGPFASLGTSGDAPASLPTGRLLPRASERRVLLASATGVDTVSVPLDQLRPTPRPLTRRAVLEEAFGYIGQKYGFGGKDGGRDCSRLMLDLFESFGIHLPRHSAWQSRAGSYSIELSGVDEAERLLLLDAAAARGVVLMHLPGHIMLYLGRDRDERPMALHAFAEYMTTCPEDGGDILYHVDQVQVTDLELGRGTSKTAFIERIDRLMVLGPPPSEALAGVANLRPPAPVPALSRRACRRAGGARLLVSPERPDSTRPVRVVATAAAHPGPVELTLIDPAGARHTPELVRLGGPPYGYVATVDAPLRGRWTAVFGEGDDVRSCERFSVRSRPRPRPRAARRPPPPGPEDADIDADEAPDDASPEPTLAAPPVWDLRRRWTPATEDLYAIFVERLFDYPVEDDLTWPSLDALTRDAARNLLYDHLGDGEDEVLVLSPDCADLPYTLRAYFAWKLGLPFAYRKCDRARPGRPPECDPGGDNLAPRSDFDVASLSERRGDDELPPDVRAFARFIDFGLRRTVHSSSGRTHPDDDLTDFYPVPLTRRALRPGVLFADPYGHMLVVADWVPQGAGSYGVLVGADAQPDGTVGRRRFWRGSFLFDPDATSGGAGFKAIRPLELDPGTSALVALENRELRSRRRPAPYSRQQYQGTIDDFYDAMNALINPRPLDPAALQGALVDALAETVSRRVTSVQNGEDFMAERGYADIEMPEGADIFLTTGPWEDYSTPSRDLRLLISIDTVVGFPDAVGRAPAQFGVRADQVEATVAALRAALDRALAAERFSYTRSDGSEQSLTLAELVRRLERLEMAYNPNDCIEIRWAAAPGSSELSTCERHAPAEQRARMQQHRGWFASRKRPPN
ncbi:NlpC/P60 family protein [Haliangium sp.]|uniref:NlpC/P60 family protein n=1 Tax=Haliangium sp. TaxID=2663208 RepID=UPI003D0C6444